MVVAMDTQARLYSPRRDSCDRCHDQKVRCLKQSGSPRCIRCAKARVRCTYSSSARRLRLPKDPSQVPRNASQDGVSDSGLFPYCCNFVQTCWLITAFITGEPAVGASMSSGGLNLDTLHADLLDSTASHALPFPSTSLDDSWNFGPDTQDVEVSAFLGGGVSDEAYIQNLSGARAGVLTQDTSRPALAAAPPTREPHTDDASSFERDGELAFLNLRMCQHARTLFGYYKSGRVSSPAVVEEDEPSPNAQNLVPPYGSIEDHDHMELPIDKTFELMQDLINIYPHSCPSDMASSSPDPAGNDFVQPLAAARITDTAFHHTQIPTSKVNHASVLLLLSCHSRIIDISVGIIGFARRCIERARRDTTSRDGNTIQILQCQVGSFLVSPSESLAMQTNLLIRLSQRLKDCVDRLTLSLEALNAGPDVLFSQASLNTRQENESGHGLASMIVACQDVKRKSKAMSQQAIDLHRTLGDMKII